MRCECVLYLRCLNRMHRRLVLSPSEQPIRGPGPVAWRPVPADPGRRGCPTAFDISPQVATLRQYCDAVARSARALAYVVARRSSTPHILCLRRNSALTCGDADVTLKITQRRRALARSGQTAGRLRDQERAWEKRLTRVPDVSTRGNRSISDLPKGFRRMPTSSADARRVAWPSSMT